MTLEDFLEFNCRYVETEAPKLPAGDDLRPCLAYIREDGSVTLVNLQDGMYSTATKDAMMAWCRALLRADRAQMYAIVAAAWYITKAPEHAEEAVKVVNAEGTGGRYRDERRECYMISTGDRSRSLFAVLDVKRDYKGKIRSLIRGDVGKDPTAAAVGRMFNLLSDEEPQ
jgi:hypothetical protein